MCRQSSPTLGRNKFNIKVREQMKREVEREIRLPAFALQLGELELLWQRMQQLFESADPKKEAIDFSFL
jgi:hypothetical protein